MLIASPADCTTAPTRARQRPIRARFLQLQRAVAKHVNAFDCAVFALFVYFAILAIDITWPAGASIRESDSAILCCFAAALDMPANFANDFLLSNRDFYDYYATVQIPLARVIARFNGGNYGRAFMAPAYPLIVIQLTGFYVLGRVMYKSRFVALALSLTGIFLIWTPGKATYWGIVGVGIARHWFQAFLPWVLTAALVTHRAPRRWVWVMVATGALIYLHPVSTPAWALAIWAGLWFSFPRSWSFPRRFVWMFIIGVVFLLVSSGFVVRYLGAERGEPMDPEALKKIVAARFLPAYTNIQNTAIRVVRHLISTGFFQFGVVGGAVGWAALPKERHKITMAITWFWVIIFMGLVVPFLDHEWAHHNGTAPYQYDLIRTSRYAYPILTMLALWPLAVAGRFGRRGRIAMVLGGVMLLGTMTLRHPSQALWERGHSVAEDFRDFKLAKNREAQELADEKADEKLEEKRKRVRETAESRDEALLWIRANTPITSRFLASAGWNGLHIRYVGYRSVVYSYKDGGILYYSNHDALQKWYANLRRLQRSKSTRHWIKHGRRLKADYLFVAQSLPKDKNAVFVNQHFTIIGLNKRAVKIIQNKHIQPKKK